MRTLRHAPRDTPPAGWVRGLEGGNVTASEAALIASYVCPWGTMLVGALSLSWTVQRLSADGVFIGLFGAASASPARSSATPLAMPRPSPARVRIPPPEEEAFLPEEDDPTGETRRG